MARKFFYVCAGLFLLALSYHFGASTAGAQVAAAQIAGFAIDGGPSGLQHVWVIDVSGNVYRRDTDGTFYDALPAHALGSFWGTGPTPALHESWGSLKARYAPNRGAAKPGAVNR